MLKCLSVVIGMVAATSIPAVAQDWQKEWADTLARSKGQTLAIAVHGIEGHAHIVREFQKKFPDIKVQLWEGNPSQFAPRVLTEQKNGIHAWDVWWAATSNMTNTVQPAGGLEKITDYMILPEVKDEANWRVPAYLYTSPKGPYVLVHSYLQERTVFANTSVLRGIKLEEAEHLLNPSLRGRIAVRDPSRSNNGTFTLASIMRDKGPALLERLFSEQNVTVIDNPRQLTDAVMRGDAAVAIGTSPDTIAQCTRAGGCKDIVRLPFGGVLFSRGVSVLKKPPNPDAAKVWVNWFLSKEGQELFVREWIKYNDGGAMSFRKDVAADPRHKESEPDYTAMEKYFLAGTESGEVLLSSVIKMYTAIKNR
jgi:ABC-type Fe3+ transport system substrate-binding protein